MESTYALKLAAHGTKARLLVKRLRLSSRKYGLSEFDSRLAIEPVNWRCLTWA